MKDRTYLVTDQCAYEEKAPEGYSTDPKRTPHAIMLVDVDTGSVKYLLSGSHIKITDERMPQT